MIKAKNNGRRSKPLRAHRRGDGRTRIRVGVKDRKRLLTLPEVAMLPFAAFEPVREFPTYRGQQNRPNSYSWTRPRKFIGCESLLERSIVEALEYSGGVDDIVGQPLVVIDGAGGPGHTPDLLVKWDDGRLELIDVFPRNDAGDERRHYWSEVTAEACDLLGWAYSIRHELDELFAANIAWLSGYASPPPCLDAYRERVLDAFSEPRQLADVEQEIGRDDAVIRGDLTAARVLMRPVVMHLLWLRELEIDGASPLESNAVIWRGR